MSRTGLKQALLLFAAPICWFALLGIDMLVAKTPWGISGHPSNGLILLIWLLMAAPIFGLAGCTYAYVVMRKAHSSTGVPGAAMLTNMCVLGVGIVFWHFLLWK